MKDNFPLPRIYFCFGAHRGNQWCSTLDLASGYQQVDMDPQDAAISDFVTKKGPFKFKRFRLCNAGLSPFPELCNIFYLDYNETCV